MSFPRPYIPLLLLSLAACGPTVPTAPPRNPGERKPMSATCDDVDPVRCGLPFPSNTFTVADSTTETGLRVALDRRAIPLRESGAPLNHADGFSRISPIATGFKGKVKPASVEGALIVLVAQPGAADDGERVPLRLELAPSESKTFGAESLLIGYPLRPLTANADHVAVVMDTIEMDEGDKPAADRLTRLALGLDEATNDEEAQRVAYHAPTRAALERAGVDKAHVVRVWDFTTRSKNDARVRLDAMRTKARAAVDSGAVQVIFDVVSLNPAANVAAVVEGRLTNLPYFRDADKTLVAEPNGVHEAPFRVMIPAGAGNYRVVLYGHGTGGNHHDDLFDEQLGQRGLSKVASVFYGWNDAVVVETFLSLTSMIGGVSRSTAGLMQAMADYSAIERALNGVLGDALAAPMLDTQVNPAAGRRPDATEPIWTGGSLGGTMGLVFSGLSPNVKHAVLNVPGAGWTHFVPGSDLYELIRPALQGGYPSPLDFRYALLASQLAWDDVDGANYVDDLAGDGSVYLVQLSIGDNVLPNVGSKLVAASVKAVHLGKVLDPVEGVPVSDSAENKSALTQFKVSATAALEKHGFASRNTAAGAAAREQISNFIASVLAGQPRITVPPGCLNGSCDFSTP